MSYPTRYHVMPPGPAVVEQKLRRFYACLLQRTICVPDCACCRSLLIEFRKLFPDTVDEVDVP